MHDHTARGGLGRPKGREALIPTSATGIVAQGVYRFDDTYSVRVLGTPDEPEFVAADVSGPLGYRMASDMTRRLDDDEKGTRSVRTPSGDQQMTVLTEAGLYAAILGSKSPTAKPFKRWVTHTVLPAIRKTGSYGAQQPALPGRRELAQMVIDAEDRAEAETQRRAIAETKLAAEQQHRKAIEGGDGIDLTTFGKKYFSDVRKTDFDKHLYSHGYLINQHNTRMRADGTLADGFDHRKPTAKGRAFIYAHDTGNYGGRRRFMPRVRPQKEIELRDALAAEGLPVNTHSTGLVLLTSDEMKELGA